MPLPEPEVPSGPTTDGPDVTSAEREAYADVALIYREFCRRRGLSFAAAVSRLMLFGLHVAGGDADLIAEATAAVAKVRPGPRRHDVDPNDARQRRRAWRRASYNRRKLARLAAATGVTL